MLLIVVNLELYGAKREMKIREQSVGMSKADDVVGKRRRARR